MLHIATIISRQNPIQKKKNTGRATTVLVNTCSHVTNYNVNENFMKNPNMYKSVLSAKTWVNSGVILGGHNSIMPNKYHVLFHQLIHVR